MNKKSIILLTTSIIIIVVIISIVIAILWNSVDGWDTQGQTPFLVEQNIDEKTLIVIQVKKEGLSWDDVEIFEGSANLPEGKIEINDVITDCSGHLVLVWKPTDSVLADIYFS